jgi:sulfite reductase (ferredoxin)
MAAKNVEDIKTQSAGLRGSIARTLHTDVSHFSDEEYQLLKFHGTYQQDDRDRRSELKAKNLDKAWMFMVRTKIPGGALSPEQYLDHDRVADTLGNGTIRITTRQGIQLHGVLKGELQECIRRINDAGLTTWGACGDVVRNTTAPAAPFRDRPHQDAQRLAKDLSDTFLSRSSAYSEIWLNGEKLNSLDGEGEPIYGKHYLPRKFKIGIAVPPRNDVDVYSNDLGFISLVEEGRLVGYNIVVGGGFGMSHGKVDTFPALAQPLFFVRPNDAVRAAVAIVTTQRDYGNREDRKRARMKYLIEERGIDWFSAEVLRRADFPVFQFRAVRWDSVSDYLGWHEQGDGKLFCGVWVQEGRIKDSSHGQYKSAFREITQRFGFPIRLTTNCNLIFCDIDPELKEQVEEIFFRYGVASLSALTPTRQISQACVALPTCGLALAESERVFPAVLDEIDAILKDLDLATEPILVRMTGCPNGCARPYNADIAFVGRAPGKYALYVGGSLTGERLAGLQEKVVAIEAIPDRVRTILQEFAEGRKSGENFSDYWGRTHLAGPRPHPDQFHQELSARKSERLIEAAA